MRFALIIFSFVCCLTGCATGGDEIKPQAIAASAQEFPTVSLNQLPNVDVGAGKLAAKSRPELVLLPIIDQREDKTVLRYRGKEVVPAGDATLSVSYALQKAFRQKGIALKSSAALQLEVSITGWNTKVSSSPNGGEELQASAVLTAQLVAGGDQPVFNGFFEGSASLLTSEVLDREIEQALKTAMGKALSQLVQDQKLMDTISSY